MTTQITANQVQHLSSQPPAFSQSIRPAMLTLLVAGVLAAGIAALATYGGSAASGTALAMNIAILTGVSASISAPLLAGLLTLGAGMLLALGTAIIVAVIHHKIIAGKSTGQADLIQQLLDQANHTPLASTAFGAGFELRNPAGTRMNGGDSNVLNQLTTSPYIVTLTSTVRSDYTTHYNVYPFQVSIDNKTSRGLLFLALPSSEHTTHQRVAIAVNEILSRASSSADLKSACRTSPNTDCCYLEGYPDDFDAQFFYLRNMGKPIDD